MKSIKNNRIMIVFLVVLIFIVVTCLKINASAKDNSVTTNIKIQKNVNKNEKEVKSVSTDEIPEVKDVHFNPLNVLEVSNISEKDLYEILEGTSLYELAPYYIEAENLYGVNALFMTALTAQESGWGTSDRAIRDNNLTGFGVYSNSSKGINSVTKRDNILQTAKCLKERYLTKGSSYHNGFDIYAINENYCLKSDGTPDYSWSDNITSIGYKLKKAKENSYK